MKFSLLEFYFDLGNIWGIELGTLTYPHGSWQHRSLFAVWVWPSTFQIDLLWFHLNNLWAADPNGRDDPAY